MRSASQPIDRLAAAGLLALSLTAIACAPPRVRLVVVPAALVHDLTAWADDDTVCVAVPPVQAVYVPQQCLSMRAIRALILDARSADEARR